METIGVPELLIILVIVILVFGIGRISKIGSELGGGIRAFREGLRGNELDPNQKNESQPELVPVTVTLQPGENAGASADLKMPPEEKGEPVTKG